jgi:Succinylglutamate desuccinylase / Aspartoacylase family
MQSAPPYASPYAPPHAPPHAPPYAQEILPPQLGRWRHSSSGLDYVHERLGPCPGPDVLVTALVHGNEYAGAIVLDELLQSAWLPQRGRVTFAFCNVAAFERFDSHQPDASRCVDEDFNRLWLDRRLHSAERSHELSRARQLLPFVKRATHLLDLHTMHEAAPALLVTGTLPRNIAFAQALQTSAQVIIDSGHADGVRMRDYGGFSDPLSGPFGEQIALLLEAGQHWQADSVRAARNCLMRFLIHAGSLKRANVPPGWMASWLLPDAQPAPPLAVTDRVVARSMDFAFTQPFQGGEVIAQAGTVIAHDAGQALTTPYDNCALVMPSLRQLRPGVTVVRLAKTAVAQ